MREHPATEEIVRSLLAHFENLARWGITHLVDPSKGAKEHYCPEYFRQPPTLSSKELPSASVTPPPANISNTIQSYPFDIDHSADTTTNLNRFADQIKNCTNCNLYKERKQVVFGVGNPEAKITIVGEAPGRDEDMQGYPFVGRAGRLLDKMLDAIDLDRSKVYIANVIKCRPPENRDPEPNEIATCEVHLKIQLEIIKPTLIITLGKFAAQVLLKTTTPISKLRGIPASYQNIPLIPTFHPAYLLRNPMMKKMVWKDLQLVRKLSQQT